MNFWIAFGAALVCACSQAEAEFEAANLLPGYVIVIETPQGDVIEVEGPFALIG